MTIPWKLIRHPFCIANVVLAVSFVFLKMVHPVCDWIFDDCQLEMRDWELLTFLGCIVALRNRRMATVFEYFRTVCFFLKLCNVVMFYRQSTIICAAYCFVWLLQFLFITAPQYEGPSRVVYFDERTLEEELKTGDKRVTWLVEFFASWSPACVDFASVFAELSAEYGDSKFLRFGKLDAARYPDAARNYRIATGSLSRQLPTVIMFQHGREVDRRPACDAKMRVLRFMFTKQNMISDFDLNELYAESKRLEKGKYRKADAGADANADAPTAEKAEEQPQQTSEESKKTQ